MADHTPAADARGFASGLQAALLEAKVAVGVMRDALAASERELELERKQLEDAERRGRLAAAIPDAETVQIAERFAERHRARSEVLGRKIAVQRDELSMAERELGEMNAQFRAAKQGTVNGVRPEQEAAWRDLQAAGGARPETDVEDALLRNRMDRAMHEAAADAQLEHLKKKMGKKEK
ncbi:MAG: hypothetical protein ABJD11_04995 [Gemmatimonadota bacterium]